MAINGTLLTEEKDFSQKEGGIKRVSLSLDGKDAKTHDAFRGLSAPSTPL